MADDPPSVHEQSTEPNHDCDSYCPFCTITSTFQPISPSNTTDTNWDPDRLAPPTYVFLSTEHIVAFLDIAPLTRGHVLVTPRRHRTKVGDCSADEAAEVSLSSFSLEWNVGMESMSIESDQTLLLGYNLDPRNRRSLARKQQHDLGLEDGLSCA